MKKHLFFLISLTAAALVCATAFASGVKITSVEGDVRAVAPGANAQVACAEGAELSAGTTISTSGASHVDIAFDESGANTVRIKSDSIAVLKLDGPDKVELESGEAFISLGNLQKGETFRVRTPYSVCGARGTAWSVKISGERVYVSVLRGKVFVRGIGRDGTLMDGELLLEQGCETSIRKFERPRKYSKISRENMDILEKENASFIEAASVREMEKPVSSEKAAVAETSAEEVKVAAEDKEAVVAAPGSSEVDPSGAQDVREEEPASAGVKAVEYNEDPSGIAGDTSSAGPAENEKGPSGPPSAEEEESAENAAKQENMTAAEGKKEADPENAPQEEADNEVSLPTTVK